jgi:CelD/BcsL family acetyltransferase involved in cellulose biosynthesis
MNKVELVKASELGPAEHSLWAKWRAEQAGMSSPYFSSKWTQAVARVREDIQVAVVLDQNKRVSGFLPLQRPPGRIAVPVGGALNDYNGMVSRPGFSCDLQDIMHKAKVGRLDFSHVPETQSNFSKFALLGHDSHVIDLSNGLEAYLQARRDRGSSETKRARKRKRKLAREVGEVHFEAHSCDQAAFDQLLRWKRDQYHHTSAPDVFAAGWTKELVQNLFETGGPERFGGSLFLLYAADKLIAANYCLADTDILHAWFIAHDPQMARYSPGQILFESMIEHLADTSLREIDLGAGDYRFKTVLANSSRSLHAGFVAGCPVSSFIRDSEYKIRHWVERMPLGEFSELPGKLMRRMDVYRGLA